MQVRNTRKLGELAIEAGALTEAQLAEGLEAQRQIAGMGLKKRLGEILVERGLLSSDALEELLAVQQRDHQQRVFGPYALGPKLGEGGMGAVYRATRVADGAEVALKVLIAGIARDPVFLERFERECAVAAKLAHPNLVRTMGAETVEDRHVLVMEYVRGETIEALLARRAGRLAETEALSIAAQLARAVAYLDAQGVVHRDIKPANVILADDGVAKLLDLGLAKQMDRESQQITVEGQIVGTPDFMAPEQILGQPVDGRADVYALGATLYTMLTGQTPYGGRGDYQKVLMGHLSGAFGDPLELAPELSAGAVHIVEKCLATLPEDRYADMTALLADLEPVMAGGAPATVRLDPDRTMVARAPRVTPRAEAAGRRSRTSGKGKRRRRPQEVDDRPAWALAAVAALVLVGALVFAFDLLPGSGSGSPADPLVQEVGGDTRPGPPPPTPTAPDVFWRHDRWGLTLRLPAGWRELERIDEEGQWTTAFQGPSTATMRLELVARQCARVPAQALAESDRRLSAAMLDREPGELTPVELGTAEAPQPGYTLGGRRWFALVQTPHLLARLRWTDVSREMVQATLRSLSADAELERAMLGEATVARGGGPGLRFAVPADWTARPWGRGNWSLTRGSHQMLVLLGPREVFERALKAGTREALGNQTECDFAGRRGVASFHLRRDPRALLVVVACKRTHDTLWLVTRLDASVATLADLLAPWRVMGGLEIDEQLLAASRGAAMAGLLVDREYRYARVRSKTDVRPAGSFRIEPGSRHGLGGGVLVAVARMAGGEGEPARTVTVAYTPEPAGVRLRLVRVEAGDDRDVYTVRGDGVTLSRVRGGKTTTRRVANEAPRGIYLDGCPIPAILWPVGMPMNDGARRTLKVLDLARGDVAELRLSSVRAPEGFGLDAALRDGETTRGRALVVVAGRRVMGWKEGSAHYVVLEK